MVSPSPGENMYSNSSRKSTVIGIIIGLISGVLVIPVSFSFAAIIFRSEEFSTQLSSLSKLVLISSAIHQLCFSYFSSLPFAIGQVQDAGLVFLAAIADSIATNVDHDKIIPTTLVILPICTTILGVLMVVVGKLKIANLIQFLPMPVVGGYLAFIGLPIHYIYIHSMLITTC
jgi:SulP family sulfate permease